MMECFVSLPVEATVADIVPFLELRRRDRFATRESHVILTVALYACMYWLTEEERRYCCLISLYKSQWTNMLVVGNEKAKTYCAERISRQRGVASALFIPRQQHTHPH